MQKLKAEIFKSKRTAACRISFRIPLELAKILENYELSKEQKINLVKSYTEKLRDEDNNLLPNIPEQHAVIMIMALEVKAL
jgi:hypothetical protein